MPITNPPNQPAKPEPGVPGPDLPPPDIPVPGPDLPEEFPPRSPNGPSLPEPTRA
jgi:hypothetical protein